MILNRGRQLKKHGMCKSLTYKVWQCIRQRCLNPNNDAFANYGGRGITVDATWENFIVFLADMGERPKGMEINRIDNNKGYSKKNCKWSTSVENQNNRRNNRWISYNGKMVTVTQASRLCGVKPTTIFERLKKGCTNQQAVRPCAR